MEDGTASKRGSCIEFLSTCLPDFSIPFLMLSTRISGRSHVYQPYNAALMSQVHKAGFELVNVRTGKDGMRLPYRYKGAPESDRPTFTVDAVRFETRELLAKPKGDEGTAVRKNYERLGENILSGWDKDGKATKNIEAFLEKFVA